MFMITGVQDGSVGRIRYHRDMILGRVHRVAVHSFDDCNVDRSTGTQRAVPLRLGPQVQTLLPREGQRRSERRAEGGGGSGSTIPRIRDTGGGRGDSKNGTIAQAREPSAVEGRGQYPWLWEPHAYAAQSRRSSQGRQRVNARGCTPTASIKRYNQTSCFSELFGLLPEPSPKPTVREKNCDRTPI
jgi:hypothetical protein